MQCPKCNNSCIGYYPEFGFYGCPECGHGWGGSIEGEDLNIAYYAVQSVSREIDRNLIDTDLNVVRAYEVAFDNLAEIAFAIAVNPALKTLPSNPHWWIQNRDNIRSALMLITQGQIKL